MSVRVWDDFHGQMRTRSLPDIEQTPGPLIPRELAVLELPNCLWHGPETAHWRFRASVPSGGAIRPPSTAIP